MPRGGAYGREHRGEIGGNDLVPKLIGNVLDRPVGVPLAVRRQEAWTCIDAGIGEHHVELAEAIHGFVDGLLEASAIGHIDEFAFDRAASTAERLDASRELHLGAIE